MKVAYSRRRVYAKNNDKITDNNISCDYNIAVVILCMVRLFRSQKKKRSLEIVPRFTDNRNRELPFAVFIQCHR